MKDFTYYADRAEECLNRAKTSTPEKAELRIAAAAVYAELAKGAPKQVRPPVYRDGNMHAAGAPVRDDS